MLAPATLTIGAAAGLECPVTVEGRTFSSTEDPAFEAELRRLAATGRRARVDGGPNTPYRCIGGAIYRAQRAGFSRVGFAAEPPASGE